MSRIGDKCPFCGGEMYYVGKWLQKCNHCRLTGIMIGPGDNFKDALKEVFMPAAEIFKLKPTVKKSPIYHSHRKKRQLILNGDELEFIP